MPPNCIAVDEAIDGGTSTQALKALGPKEKKSKLNSHYQLINNSAQKVCAVRTRALAFVQKKWGFLYQKIW